MTSAKLYEHPSEMEPMWPTDPSGALLEAASMLWRDSAAIRGILPDASRDAVAEVVRSMNGYYSNLIEGHQTRPMDIEAALTRNFSQAPKERERQLLHAAHLETLKVAEESLASDPSITSPEYLCWLHAEFFKRLPEELLTIRSEDGKDHRVSPGQLRQANVSVGQHLAPAHHSLPKMLEHFDRTYRSEVRDTPGSLVAAAAAHHRLTWIHPFDDGNGRIARMFMHLWFVQAGAGGAGLWTLSRGLARRIDIYRQLLAEADEKRLGDFDGRGRMSNRKLVAFCTFLLESARDQVAYMAGMLKVDTLADRLEAAVLHRELSGDLPKRSSKVLRAILFQGVISRTEVSRIMGTSPRTAQPVVRVLLERGYLKSPSERGKLSISFPGEISAYVFPDLFPAGSPL